MGPPRGGFVDREVGLSGPAETEEVVSWLGFDRCR